MFYILSPLLCHIISNERGDIMYSKKTFSAKEKEMRYMPSVEAIEYERTVYINEMKEYLSKLKKMEHETAREESLKNLIASQIIGENGEFTERYAFARMNAQK